jgi:Fasciclin domain
VLEEYSCVHGEVAYSSLLTDGKTLQTVLGSDVTITVLNGSIYVNAAKIVDPDYLLSNGVLHILDRYLTFNSLVLMSLIIDVGDHRGLDPYNTSGPPNSTLSGALSSPHSNLSTGAEAGIGIGGGLGGLALIALAWYFIHIRKVDPIQQAEKRESPSASKRPQDGKRLGPELGEPERVYEIG